jgi:hypothetical protein
MAMTPDTLMSPNMRDEIVAMGMGKIRALWKVKEPENKCPICLNILEEGPIGFLNVVFTKCGHPFHPCCMRRFMAAPGTGHGGSHPCPSCREPLLDDDMEIPEDDFDPDHREQ